MSEEQPAAAPAPPKRGKGLMIVLVVLIVAGSAGGGAFWWARRGVHAQARVEEPKPVERGIVTFEPFVVNLADSDAPRFLRASIQLVVDSPEKAEKVQKTPVSLMRARSAILEVLTTQTSAVVVTPDGKAKLKKQIEERVGPVLEEVKVQDVLFSDFVIQY